MQLFVHTPNQIRIINADQEWRGTPSIFAAIEEDYPGLPQGMTDRYWTPEFSFVQGTGQTTSPDPLNCLPFIENIAAYLNTGKLYAHVTISQPGLCINADPAESITFHADLKLSADPAASNVDIDHTWIIRLRHQDGLAFDAFEAVFDGGECEYVYIYKDGTPLGFWQLLESDLELVMVGEQQFQVVLVQPIIFALYRRLA